MATINYLTRVEFGAGERRLLPTILGEHGVARPLVVTDRGLLESGTLDLALEALEPTGVTLFAETPGNPTEAAGRAALARYREAGCDGIVGIGGGSSLDLAKAVAVLAVDDGPLERHAFYRAGYTPAIPPTPPIFLMPTTAGTGSEVGRATLMIFDSGRKAPVVLGTQSIKAAICDPDLTLHLPPYLTAATGIDAISHCVETFASPRVNPPAEAIALDGLRRLTGAIARAVKDGPNDAEARRDMMMGAMEGAMAFQKGLGAVHALSHPLGAHGHHHGTLNGILLAPVLAHNRGALGDKWDRLAAVLECEPRGLVEFVQGLVAGLGLPTTLSEIGVDEAQMLQAARFAPEDISHASNPREMSEADYLAVLRSAL
mgnify:CR=1 FL=1